MSNETPTPCNIATALADVQAELPRILKGERAYVKSEKGAYSYAYASLADIHEVVLPRLANAGLAWSCAPTIRDDGRYVLVCTLLHGASGENMACEFPLPSQARPQELGSAITYARRYALCAMVGIAADEDDDGQAAEQAARQQQEQRRPRKQRPARKNTQNTQPEAGQPTALCPDDALRQAIGATTPEEVTAVWHACDLNAPVSPTARDSFAELGVHGKTLKDLLTAIGNHVKTRGTPFVTLWNTEGA